MKVRSYLNGIINYMGAIALSLIFALYLSGRIGWFLFAAFICAPVVSVLLTLVFVGRINAYAQVDSAAVCKGESCSLTVNITCSCFLPSPPVIIEMFSCPRAVCTDKSVVVSLMPYGSESFEASYRTVLCGPCEIGCSAVIIKDYFGLFSFELKNIDMSGLRARLEIIPDIGEVRADDPVISDIAEMVVLADDSEETSENTALRSGGFPGYESREYVPGDPLKRINWKQSAKKGKLLVRLDDEVSCPSVSVILDKSFLRQKAVKQELFSAKPLEFCTDSNIFETAEQFAVEGALGMIRALFINGYNVNFIMNGKNGWQIYPANDENDLAEIRTELAAYCFSEEEEARFPSEVLEGMKGSVSVFCTPYADAMLCAQLAPYMGKSGKEELKSALFSPAGKGGAA